MRENNTTTASGFLNLIRGKNVVYITVKNKDYIRTSQIQRLLDKEADQFRVYSSEGHNPITRALNLRYKMRKIDLEGVDVVILGFLPQLIIGALKKNKATLVAEMFLSMYDTVIFDRHIFRDSGLFAAIMKRMDRKTIEAADLVVTDTKANADYLSENYGASRDKFETLYLEADKKIYYGIASLDADYVETDEENVNNERAKKILYFGTGLPLQGTDVVMEAFNMLAADVNANAGDISFTYIGSLKGIPESVTQKAKENPRIELIDWVPQTKLARKIAQADICIAGHFNPNIEKANRTIPGKAYIYEAMNKKMILGDTTANHEIFSEDYRHIFVERGNPQKLADAIVRLLQMQ